ncbi:MAG: hypothetical protein NTY60_03765 [Proteobacteria bacterium]|nr:hypothetical protein [Pseudomonadota bacterium]
MSLLFDALKRAQGTGAKPPSGSEASAPEAKTIVAKPSGIRYFAVAGLMLLSAGAFWFIYQKNQYVPIATRQPELAAASSPAAAASPVTAASGVAVVNTLPATAAGADSLTYKDKSWTHPVEPGKHQAKKRRHKPAGTRIAVGTDLLKEGYLALSEGRLDQAERSYLAALSQHPHEKDALLGLAVIAQRKMQTDRAAELYRQVLREDLGNAAAAAGLVSLSMQADLVSAESQLRELIDLKPAAPEFHYALGNVLARQLRWGEAQQAFFRACNLAPDNALYAYNLAVSLDHLHQPAAALPYYQKAGKLANDSTLDMDKIGRRIQELKTSP